MDYERKFLSFGLVILTFALAMSLISVPQTAQAKDITIRFSGWMIGEPYARELERQRWNEFEKQNPGVKIEGVLTPFMETMQQLMVARAAGTMPDVVMLTPKWVNSFAGTDHLCGSAQILFQRGTGRHAPGPVHPGGV